MVWAPESCVASSSFPEGCLELRAGVGPGNPCWGESVREVEALRQDLAFPCSPQALLLGPPRTVGGWPRCQWTWEAFCDAGQII